MRRYMPVRTNASAICKPDTDAEHCWRLTIESSRIVHLPTLWHPRGVRRGLLLIAIVFTIGWLYPMAPAPPSARAQPGWALYDRYCLACHGEAGDGKGPAAPFTAGRPR